MDTSIGWSKARAGEADNFENSLAPDVRVPIAFPWSPARRGRDGVAVRSDCERASVATTSRRATACRVPSYMTTSFFKKIQNIF